MHSRRPTLPLSLAAVPSGRPGRCLRGAKPREERGWAGDGAAVGAETPSLSRFAVSCIEAVSRRPGSKPAPARPRCRHLRAASPAPLGPELPGALRVPDPNRGSPGCGSRSLQGLPETLREPLGRPDGGSAGTRRARGTLPSVPASGSAPERGTAEAASPGRAAAPVERGGRGGRAGPGRAVPGARAGEEPGGGGAEPRYARPRPEGTRPWRRYLGQRRRARPEPPEGTESQVRAGCLAPTAWLRESGGGSRVTGGGARRGAERREVHLAGFRCAGGTHGAAPPRRGDGRGGGCGGPGLGCEKVSGASMVEKERSSTGPTAVVVRGGLVEVAGRLLPLPSCYAAATRSARLYSW